VQNGGVGRPQPAVPVECSSLAQGAVPQASGGQGMRDLAELQGPSAPPRNRSTIFSSASCGMIGIGPIPPSLRHCMRCATSWGKKRLCMLALSCRLWCVAVVFVVGIIAARERGMPRYALSRFPCAAGVSVRGVLLPNLSSALSVQTTARTCVAPHRICFVGFYLVPAIASKPPSLATARRRRLVDGYEPAETLPGDVDGRHVSSPTCSWLLPSIRGRC
jgi:hypothetical protein